MGWVGMLQLARFIVVHVFWHRSHFELERLWHGREAWICGRCGYTMEVE